MPRISPAVLCLILSAAWSFAAPPADHIAPITAVELAIAPDLGAMEAQFGKTQLARLYHDPSMQAFFDGHGAELFGLFELPDAIGLKWDTLKTLAGGPLASAS